MEECFLKCVYGQRNKGSDLRVDWYFDVIKEIKEFFEKFILPPLPPLFLPRNKFSLVSTFFMVELFLYLSGTLDSFDDAHVNHNPRKYVAQSYLPVPRCRFVNAFRCIQCLPKEKVLDRITVLTLDNWLSNSLIQNMIVNFFCWTFWPWQSIFEWTEEIIQTPRQHDAIVTSREDANHHGGKTDPTHIGGYHAPSD